MGKLNQHITPPLSGQSVDGGSGHLCPACGHEREVHKETWVDRLWVKLGLPVGPAECNWMVAAMADPCGCDNHFHGS